MSDSHQATGRFNWSGYLIGFALGGFFDGILLHQVLQWHHLLSLVEGAGDLADQVLYDGLFHALMYAIAAIGLVMLARSRTSLGAENAGRMLLANTLIGFSAWQGVDVGLAHWIMGIHRVRIDSAHPLLWDVGWLFAFGLIPLLMGWRLRSGGGPSVGGRAAAAGIVLTLSIAGPWAARAPAGSDGAMVVFRPGMSEAQAWNAVAAADGSVLWRSRGIWAVRWNGRDRSARLYGEGALLVSSSFLAGCLAWTKA